MSWARLDRASPHAADAAFRSAIKFTITQRSCPLRFFRFFWSGDPIAVMEEQPTWCGPRRHPPARATSARNRPAHLLRILRSASVTSVRSSSRKKARSKTRFAPNLLNLGA